MRGACFCIRFLLWRVITSAQIDCFDNRQRPPLHSLGELQEPIAPLAAILVTLEGRGRRAENNRAIEQFGSDYRDVATMIAQAVFLFVRRIMLFVDDDESEVRYRRKHRRAGTNNDIDLSLGDLTPLGPALGVGKSAVQDAHFSWKAGV